MVVNARYFIDAIVFAEFIFGFSLLFKRQFLNINADVLGSRRSLLL